MFIKWLVAVIREYGTPICFLSGLYIVLGISFLLLSPPVGVVLLSTGLAIAGLFVVLSYMTYRREQHIAAIIGRDKRDRIAVAD